MFAAGLLFWSSLASLLPTLPLYIESIGATKQQIGIVMGSFAIGMLLFRPLVGALADSRGRKIVLLIGMSVAAIAPLGYLVVKSILPLMVIRAFHGISIAAFATGYIALVGDLAPEHRRGEVIGYMSLVNPIGVALGPALGGYLQAAYGYTPLFISSSVLGSLGILCILPIANPPIVEQPTNSTDDRFWQLLISPRVRIPAIVLLLFGLALGTVHTFIALYIKSTGVNLNAGLFFTAAAISSFSVRLFTGRASDQYGRGLFITFSLMVYTLAMICIWQANNPLTFLLGGFIEGAASGTVIPMISVMMTDRALPHERGRIFGVSLMGLDFGLIIAGPILGAVAEQIGYRSMFGFATGLSVLAILIFVTQSSRNLSHSLRFAFGRGEDVYALKR
ncbi:multidrug resistance protein [Trichormus variabilis SAG 1403-4b]|uniref:Multidrug resistance protein n=1 Tax=Trichormus variabilis SAG 1403-4b TaxID=447716 RepID=A0A3S1C886_ANAVA|nr:multidrug resistance protein [Trichormus variabilis SAG 1403-4b]